VTSTFRRRISEILETGHSKDTTSRLVDIALVLLIFLNVIAIALESVSSLLADYQQQFFLFEAFSVIIFTVEYVARIWSAIELERVDADRPVISRLKYMLSPLVLID